MGVTFACILKNLHQIFVYLFIAIWKKEKMFFPSVIVIQSAGENVWI